MLVASYMQRTDTLWQVLCKLKSPEKFYLMYAIKNLELFLMQMNRD